MSTDYKSKMKALRGLVDFDYDLRKPLHPRQKGKINKYYDELMHAKGQPHRIYRTKNKQKLKAVQAASGMELKGFKIAVIPDLDPKNPVKVDYKDGLVIYRGKYQTKIFRAFDPLNLILDPENEINKTLSNLKGQFVSIACGKFEFAGGAYFGSLGAAKEKTLQLMNEYNNETANNYFGNWLHGFYDIDVKNQQKVNEQRAFKEIYKNTKSKKKRERLLKRK